MDASSTDAPNAEAPSKPKGTGVFFGPALASRLAGSRRSSTDSKASKGNSVGPRSLSFTNGPANVSEAHQGRGQSQAGMRTSLPPKRRASMDVLHHQQSNSTTNLGLRSSTFTSARSCSTPGGLPQQIITNSSPCVDVSMFQLRPQQAHAPDFTHVPDFSANVPMGSVPKAFSVQQHPLSPQAQLQQQAHDENPLQQQQLQLQEVQQLQSELQQLLHQQQLRQQMASPQQPLASVSSTSTDGIMLVPSGPTSPDMARQLQALQQPATQQLLLSSMSSGLLDTTFAALNGSEVQPCTHASTSLSISSLGPSPDFNTAYLPAMPSADYQVASQQQLQARATMQPVQDTSAADEAEVTVLDGLINQCLVRLLQLRNKISNKVAGCADGGAAGAAGAAAGGPGDYTPTPSAVGFMADGMLQQTASQPLIMLQQQSSSMMAPVHLATSSVTATGQVQLLQQQQQQQQRDSAAGTLALLQHGGGGAAGLSGGSATGLMVSGGNMVPLTNGQASVGSVASNTGAAAPNFPNVSAAYAHLMAHDVSGPILVQQQPRLQPQLQLQQQPQQQQHHQQLLYQPAGALRLVRGSGDGGDGSTFNGYINLTAGAVPQGVVLTQPAMQPAQGQGMLNAAAQQQFAGGAVQHGDVQQLQAQLARQQFHGMLQ